MDKLTQNKYVRGCWSSAKPLGQQLLTVSLINKVNKAYKVAVEFNNN